MAEANLIFSKIVAFPKPYFWSQAYNAGKLFAALSLKIDSKDDQEAPDSLSILGKSVLDKLEEEFFTIETKNLESIKQAVITTLKEIPDEITSSFTAVVFIDNVLYSFAKGNGKVFIKRGEKFGAILDGKSEDIAIVTSSSGKLEDNDLIVLATQPFLDIVDPTFLSSSLGNLTPSEIAETLTPKIHEKDDGGAAAFIVKYSRQLTQPTIQEETKQETENPQPGTSFLKKHMPFTFPQFSHSKKKFLTVAIVILIVLVSSIYFAVKKQNDSKTKELFDEVYSSALKKYDEGNSLLDLNKSLAIDSLTISKNLLNDNKDKFNNNSKEQSDILALLKKVDKALVLTSATNQVKAKEVNADSNFFLKTQVNNPNVNLFAQDNNNVYFLDNNSITSLDKKTNKKVAIIKNDNNWKSAVGLAIYLGNIYALDKDTSQILKFVETKDGFTKTNYFTESSPNLSDAQSMTIDGSIWVLFKDGTIQKFTKGKKDSFILSGFKESISNPTRIFTNADAKNIYILNTSKSSILVFGKDGVYQSQYQTDILKNAKDFEVKEADKKIFVLSQNKMYEMELK